jgi:chromosomal replication initiator protein
VEKDATLWEQCQERLKDMLEPSDYRVLVPPMRAQQEGDRLRLYGQNEWMLQKAEQVLLPKLDALCEEIAGRKMSLDLKLLPYEEGEDWKGEAKPVKARTRLREPLNKVDEKLTFECFIEGRANELAKIYAMQVVEEPAQVHNPLLIYGASGLGKTHLLQAIVNRFREKESPLFVEYVTTREFRQEVVGSLRPSKESPVRFANIEELKRWYREVDVLLFDDIHFLAGAEQTQEEIFDIFNKLMAAKKQMVFTSDRYPREIPNLEDRLITRFLGGQAVCVELPELETRIAILLTKAEERGIYLEDDMAVYMAERIRTNVRELEGALIQVHHRAAAQYRRIDQGLVSETLRDAFRVAAVRLSLENIQSAVADYYRIKRTDLLAETRERRIVLPRQMAMYLCTELTDKSLIEIGKAFHRDHTTVMHARNRIAEKRRTDADVADDCRNLRRELGN